MFRFLVKFFYHVKVISHTSRYVQDFFSQQEIVVLWQTSSQQVLPCPSPFFFSDFRRLETKKSSYY